MREASQRLFRDEPELLLPGGNAYTTRRLAACLRDMDYFLRYASYALVAGDSTILNERVLNGLDDTYKSLACPRVPTVRTSSCWERCRGTSPGRWGRISADWVLSWNRLITWPAVSLKRTSDSAEGSSNNRCNRTERLPPAGSRLRRLHAARMTIQGLGERTPSLPVRRRSSPGVQRDQHTRSSFARTGTLQCSPDGSSGSFKNTDRAPRSALRGADGGGSGVLRYAWQTDNRLTLPMSGTGSAAMEATLANTVEPGDTVLVAVKGYFGLRLADMAGRYRATVKTIEKPWGEWFSLEELEAAMIEHKPAILALVHAETSTGVCQPMEGVGDLCRQHNCLLLLDTVTSLGGVPLYIDEWKVDLAYSCSQKGLSCPPGLGPFTMGPRAEDKMTSRSEQSAELVPRCFSVEPVLG